MYTLGVFIILSFGDAQKSPPYQRRIAAEADWDAYCRALNGGSSFCLKTQLLGDFCAFGNEPCGSGSIPSYTTRLPTTAASPVTTEMPPSAPATTVTPTLPPEAWDGFCRDLNGPASFCLSTSLLGNFCAFGNQPCASGPIPSTSHPSTDFVTSTVTTRKSTATTRTSTTTTRTSTTTTRTSTITTRTSTTTTRTSTTTTRTSTTTTRTSTPTTRTSTTTTRTSTTTTRTSTTTTRTSTTTTRTSTTTRAEMSATSPASTTRPATLSTTTIDVSTVDSRLVCGHYCKHVNGPASYCKDWLPSPVCQYGNQPCGSLANCQSLDISTTAPQIHSSTSTKAQQRHCDGMCKSLNGPASYCKSWTAFPVCQGGNQPCGDSSACSVILSNDSDDTLQDCSSICTALNGIGSYCKVWKDPPTCQGGDQLCGSPYCK